MHLLKVDFSSVIKITPNSTISKRFPTIFAFKLVQLNSYWFWMTELNYIAILTQYDFVILMIWIFAFAWVSSYLILSFEWNLCVLELIINQIIVIFAFTKNQVTVVVRNILKFSFQSFKMSTSSLCWKNELPVTSSIVHNCLKLNALSFEVFFCWDYTFNSTQST